MYDHVDNRKEMTRMLYSVPPNEYGFANIPAKIDIQNHRWIPLWIHSLDTGYVAEYLANRLPHSILDCIASNPSDCQKIVSGLSLMHDVGKITPEFQRRILSGCSERKKPLEMKGLFIPDSSVHHQDNKLPHGPAGEILMQLAGCYAETALVIGAHHGAPWTDGKMFSSEIEKCDRQFEDIDFSGKELYLWGSSKQKPKWQAIQKEGITWMLAQIPLQNAAQFPKLSKAGQMLMTGIVIMADWIASNEAFFPLIGFDSECPENLSKRGENGLKAFHLPSGWVPSPDTAPSELCMGRFGFLPNEIQKTITKIVSETQNPGLIILEAPMGSGKTEAALLSAELMPKSKVNGIFFGLPTQATANAILDRMLAWGEKQFENNQASIRLAHGMAKLNEQFQSLIRSDSAGQVEADASDRQSRLIVHEWFQGSKQALLADFVIGTVDQLLRASLKEKHMMLRHLGLCSKAVIIDECHSYDTYMNQYLDCTLSWLGQYHTPVILLSATLPYRRRAELMDAYLCRSKKSKRTEQKPEEWRKSYAYPLLTWTDFDSTEERVHQLAIDDHGSSKRIDILPFQTENDEDTEIRLCCDWLKSELENGGCAGVFLNTVKRAQHFAKQLQENLPSCRVLMLHSCFMISDRLKKEEELLRLAGKKSTSAERNHLIIVGTQVIEQSLDFDVDVMITDLCPMDLLLQRIGRMHRHDKHQQFRPDRLKQPKCYVLGCGSELNHSSQIIYDAYILMRTKAFLPPAIVLPQDISPLVQKTYDDEISPEILPEGYELAKNEIIQKQATMAKDAKAFRIDIPQSANDLHLILKDALSPSEEKAQAQVRSGEFGVEVIALIRGRDHFLRTFPWMEQQTWNENQCPSPAQCRELLKQSLRLPIALSKLYLDDAESSAALSLPEAWKDAMWLRHRHLLPFDENFHAFFGDYELTYSREYGLIYNRKGDDTLDGKGI